MTLINKSGIWIITFKDNGVNKFWIGAAKNLNHILTHKLSLICKSRCKEWSISGVGLI